MTSSIRYRAALAGPAGRHTSAPVPNFALSHRGFESDEPEDDQDRCDFSDTDFEGGLNFIAGARRRNGMFLEMKATAYGVSNVRLLVGFNF